MAAVTYFSKADATQRSETGTTLAEVTEYTVSWTNLTDAGFANGDDVIVLIKFNLTGTNTGSLFNADIRLGTTAYSTASSQESFTSEPDDVGPRGSREFMWLDRVVLSTDDGIYVGIACNSGGETCYSDDFCIFVLKLDDLAAGDFRYAEDTSSGDAPVTATDGASVTLPSASGDDWLVIATASWLIDNVANSALQRLNLAATDYMEYKSEGEDTLEQFSIGSIGYLASAGASAVCKLTYNTTNGASQDYTRSAIFALRMEAFADHIGNIDQDAVAMGGTIDTYVETNSVSLSLTDTGPVAFFAQTIADPADQTQEAYHRVQVDGADIISGLGRCGTAAYDNGGTDQMGLSSFGVASMTSGTRVIDVDCAEDRATTAYNFDEHCLVAFSLELAGGAPALLLRSTIVQQAVNRAGTY